MAKNSTTNTGLIQGEQALEICRALALSYYPHKKGAQPCLPIGVSRIQLAVLKCCSKYGHVTPAQLTLVMPLVLQEAQRGTCSHIKIVKPRIDAAATRTMLILTPQDTAGHNYLKYALKCTRDKRNPQNYRTKTSLLKLHRLHREVTLTYNRSYVRFACPILPLPLRRVVDGFNRPVGSAVVSEVQKQPDLIQKPIKQDGSSCTLRPYQVEGVALLERYNGKALLADEMGLGKSAQALSYAEQDPDRRLPAVVVCKSHLKPNWENEVRKFTPGTYYTAEGTSPERIPESADYIIINYRILAAWKDALRKAEPMSIFFDEGHALKHEGSQQSQAAAAIAKGIPHRIIMSGTPIENKPKEFYNLLAIVEPRLFPSFKEYGDRYCEGKDGRWGYEAEGASNLEELNYLLTNTVMIRRKKCDVLKELPPKSRIVTPVRIKDKDLRTYRSAEEDYIGWLAETDPEAADRAAEAESLVRTGGLLHLSGRFKVQAAKEWIADWLEENTGQLIVAAKHVDVLSSLASAFKDVGASFYGKASKKQKQTALLRLSSRKIRVLFANTHSLIGLNMTTASSMLVVELEAKPSTLDQAEDRIHRMGQTQNCTIYYLIAQDTIEEDVVSMLDSKRRIVAAATDGEGVEQKDLLGELLTAYRTRTGQ